MGARPLFPIPTLQEGIRRWPEVSEYELELWVGYRVDSALPLGLGGVPAYGRESVRLGRARRTG